MRVVVVSTPIFRTTSTGIPGYSGLEQLAWIQAKGLAAKGHEVFLVAPDGSECPGVTVIPVGPEKQVDEKMAYGGYKEVKDAKGNVVRPKYPGYWNFLPEADVVIDNGWQKYSYLLKGEGKLKAPVLGVMHAPVNTIYQSLPPNVEKPCFVCISNDQADHFRNLFDADCRVARNGIDIDHYKALDIPRTRRYLFLARFSMVKSPDVAIDVAKRADVELDLVGDTSITNEPEFFHHCQKMADGKKIKIIGGVTRGETVYWYSRAHAFLHLNNRFREPLGLAPLEAGACGLAVVAWKYGALKETIRQGETGFLVRSADQAVHAINILQEKSDQAMSVMRSNCRDWVASQFSLQGMVDRYDELIHEAVDGGW